MWYTGLIKAKGGELIVRLRNERFDVEIDEMPKTEFGEQTIQYKHIIDLQNLVQSEFHKIFLITVIDQNRSENIVLIGDEQSAAEQCALLQNHTLTVLLNDVIVQLDLVDCTLVRAKDLNWGGCNFELHGIENDYLIYGELYVVRLNQNLEEIWQFSGRDIFVSITGKRAFEMGTESIRLYDFLDHFYEIDFSGKLIRSRIV